MFLWASKFATAKIIECSLEMGKETPLRVTFILLVMVHQTQNVYLFFIIKWAQKCTIKQTALSQLL